MVAMNRSFGEDIRIILELNELTTRVYAIMKKKEICNPIEKKKEKKKIRKVWRSIE